MRSGGRGRSLAAAAVLGFLIMASAPVDGAARTTVMRAAGTGGGDYFGSSIATSGEWLIAGAPGTDAGDDFNLGSAFAFKTNADGDWRQRQRLEASDRQASDNFGSSVAIAGDRLAIGATGEDGSLTCIGTGAGAVYVFTRSGNTWNQAQKLVAPSSHCGALYGYSLAMQGDTLVIGAKQDAAGGTSRGAVYVYQWTGATYAWIQTLTASDAADYDDFGSAVALDDSTLVVGAPRDLAHPAGKAYVFVHNGTWSQHQILHGTDNNPGDLFGSNVDIDGDLVVVGAQADDTNGYWSGAAHVFSRTGNNWSHQAKLFPPDGDTGDGNLFGWDVDVQGSLILVGAPRDERGGGNYGYAGSAYLFTSGSWTGERLVRNDEATQQFFGDRVHLVGSEALVGAFGQNNARGAIHRFDVDCASLFAYFPAGCQAESFLGQLPL